MSELERCSWCGADVEPGDGFRAYEPAGARKATFCRLEHVVPWQIQGAFWDAGELDEPPEVDAAGRRCSQCDAELGDVHVLFVSHRGPHRIADDFCSVDHLKAWANAGGRYS